MAPPGAGGDRRGQFLEAVRKEKIDTLRWSLLHGGQRVDTRDDDGYTALMIAAASNKPKALQLMLDVCRRSRELEKMDLKDGDGTEMTALMMAAANGHEACVKELLYAGASPAVTSGDGTTAEGYATKRGHVSLAALIARGGEESSEEEGEEEAGGAAAVAEEETSTQRSRRKRRELAAFESRGAKLAAAEATGESGEGTGDAGGEPAAGDEPAVPATWPEVARALEASPKELVIEREGGEFGDAPGGGEASPLDPALWRCASLNLLKITLSAAPHPLIALPPALGRLTGLRSLLLSRNGLTSLPDEIGKLTSLKVLEIDHNAISSLPPTFSQLAALETLLASHNAIEDATPIAGCSSLVSLTLDANRLTSLAGCGLGAKPRLALLSVAGNRIAALPGADLASASLLAQVHVARNALADLPYELCLLKKLREVDAEGNPLADPKLRKMLSKPASFVKELVPFLKKRGPSSAVAPPPAAPSAAAAAAHAGGDSDGEGSDGGAGAGAPAAAVQPPAGRGASKKERAKAERKAAEEAQRAAQAAAAARLAAEAAAAAAGGPSAGAGGDEDDSDDEGAVLVSRRKPVEGFAYALDPAERDRLEKADAAALRAKRAEAAAVEAAKAKARPGAACSPHQTRSFAASRVTFSPVSTTARRRRRRRRRRLSASCGRRPSATPRRRAASRGPSLSACSPSCPHVRSAARSRPGPPSRGGRARGRRGRQAPPTPPSTSCAARYPPCVWAASVRGDGRRRYARWRFF